MDQAETCINNKDSPSEGIEKPSNMASQENVSTQNQALTDESTQESRLDPKVSETDLDVESNRKKSTSGLKVTEGKSKSETKLTTAHGKDENDNVNFGIVRKSSISSVLSHDGPCNAFSRATDTSDMRLVIDGKPLYVSRLVLSIISPVFKDMFEKRARELSIFEIPLPGKKYDEMLEFLYSVYPDSLKPISDENLSVLLKLSEEYKVLTLNNRCSQFMMRQLEGNPKSVPVEKIIWFLKLAEHYQLDSVLDKGIEMATKTHSEDLENNSEFYDLSPPTTTKILMGRLRQFEKINQKFKKKFKETEAHCVTYHKRDVICSKCYASIGKIASSELSKM